MRQFARRPVAIGSTAVGLAALLVILLLAAFSRQHRPLEYMVAGTLATTLALAGAFAALIGKRKL